MLENILVKRKVASEVSWDERIRSVSAYLRLVRDERCVNSNTYELYRQAIMYYLIQNWGLDRISPLIYQ